MKFPSQQSNLCRNVSQFWRKVVILHLLIINTYKGCGIITPRYFCISFELLTQEKFIIRNNF